MTSDVDQHAGGESRDGLPQVLNGGDIKRHDRSLVIAEGRYHAIARPRKGGPEEGAAHELAVIVLDDETRVHLEPLDSENAVRSREERRRWDGKPVRVTGVIHAIMPSHGQSLVAPCLSEVRGISAR